MNIKIADENDIENLYELNKLFENENSKKEMEIFLKNNNHEIICIAYSDSIAIGYCTGLIIKSICYKSSRLDIETLFVKKEYRKNGIGKALIEFIENEAKSKNIFHFHISANNEKSKLFYEKIGYKNTEEVLLDKTINCE
ncbi:MAG: GNAT family N-acetyltransferase [Treponema sp.]|jgi:ribosomal protein S18 acetylase RimI-like enzyme|nr:GNAT family N-acetyltransferase [Treponema sp.]